VFAIGSEGCWDAGLVAVVRLAYRFALKREPGTPPARQDRDRRPARSGCGMSA